MHIVEHGQHCHEHHHEHEHCHEHSQEGITPTVLLAHTVEHNESHIAELEKLAEGFEGAAHAKIHEAIEAMHHGNELLREALKEMKE